MEEARSCALRDEFAQKRAELEGMMEQAPATRADAERLAAAERAQAVHALEAAAQEESREAERMRERCRQAQSDLDALAGSQSAAQIAACRATLEAEQLALDLAQRHEREAGLHWQDELARQGFAGEQAYRAALLPPGALAALREKTQAYCRRYNELLERLRAIDAELELDE